MSIQFKPITEDNAQKMLGWFYKQPYDMYNPATEQIESDLQNFLNPDYNYHVMLDE